MFSQGALPSLALPPFGAQAFDAALEAAFNGARRLYALDLPEATQRDPATHEPLRQVLDELLVESWVGHEALNRPYVWRVTALSRRAGLDLQMLLGQPVRLRIQAADGSAVWRSGLVQVAEALGADGGFARYRIGLVPWLHLLAHRSASRVWQDATVQQVAEDVFAPLAPWADWQWAPCALAHLQASPLAGLRGLRVQYRETDLAFLQRLLAAEGLNYRFEEHPDAAAGHRLVVFADSPSSPEDAASQAGGGIRFHRASSQEEADAIQAFGSLRRLPAGRVSLLAWDAYAQRAAALSLPVATGPEPPQGAGREHDQEHYQLAPAAPAPSRDLATPTAPHLQQRARQQADATHARHKLWLGQGTVRSWRCGQQFALRASPLDQLDALRVAAGTPPDDGHRFVLLRVLHAGINNLPRELNDRVAATLGAAFDGWSDEALPGVDPVLPSDAQAAADLPTLPVTDELLQQARATGYANSFLALRAGLPWRPLPPPPRRAPGLQTALVVGPQGEMAPTGADVHTDALGRVRVKFHWQAGTLAAPPADPRADNHLSCWIRCAQRWAGPGAAGAGGFGTRFVPRIGQEVLVEFVDGDIEQPIVVGAVYNGQGEAGSLLNQAADHRVAGQGNRVGSSPGGHAPVWHGAAAGPHANAAALSGWRSNEFGAGHHAAGGPGAGHNQLLFDDSDRQLAVQAGSTQHATWLNLGHLIHRADNYRGSLRGLGLELRTDAGGSLRAGRGLLLSTYPLADAEPAGDHSAGTALAHQMQQLAASFDTAAATHAGVRLAAHLGSQAAGRSLLGEWLASPDGEAAPLSAMRQAAAATTAAARFEPGQAASGAQPDVATSLPHVAAPIVAVSARAGLGLSAARDLQWSAGDVLHIGSGQDSHWASDGTWRLHTGQAIGWLTGVIDAQTPPAGQAPPAAGPGFTAIAAQGDFIVQAQAGPLHLAARDNLNLQSAEAHIDLAAAKRVVLRTAGGASLILQGGSLQVACPGRLTVQAASKRMVGPGTVSYALPQMPKVNILFKQDFPFSL